MHASRCRLPAAVLIAICSGCGASSPTSALPNTSHSEDAAGISAAEARAAIAALDEIRTMRACITADNCATLSQWQPTSIFQLDRSLVAIGDGLAFVRVADHWVHYPLPAESEVLANGHSALFCGRESGGDLAVFELTTEGVARHLSLPYWVASCQLVVAAGEQLYAVVEGARILHAEGSEWHSLAFEFHYGPGYGTGSAAMTSSGAYLLSAENQLFTLPSDGSSFEPRAVLAHRFRGRRIVSSNATSADSHRITVMGDEDVEAFEVVVDGAVTTIETPGAAARAAAERLEDDEGVDDDGEETDHDELRTMFESRVTMVGVDPPMIERARMGTLTLGADSAVVEITPHYEVWNGVSWTEIASDARPFQIALAMNSAEQSRTVYDFVTNFGPYRINIARSNDGRSQGPIVVASLRDSGVADVTAFPFVRDVGPVGGHVDVDMRALAVCDGALVRPGIAELDPMTCNQFADRAQLHEALRVDNVYSSPAAMHAYVERCAALDRAGGNNTIETVELGARRAYCSELFVEADDQSHRSRGYPSTGATVIADANMQNVVVFVPGSATGGVEPETVARFVGMREQTPAPPTRDLTRFARSLMVAPNLALLRSFPLSDGVDSPSNVVGIVPYGIREGQLVRVRIERNEWVVELIDAANAHAVRVHHEALARTDCRGIPSWNACTRGVLDRITSATAAISMDGHALAIVVNVSRGDAGIAFGAPLIRVVALPTSP